MPLSIRIVWAATDGGGVSRLGAWPWTTYTTEEDLASNRVLSVAAAPDGTMWFGTSGAVSRYVPPD